MKKLSLKVCLWAMMLAMVSCASHPPMECMAVESPIHLSPQARENMGLRLVKISRTGKVTISEHNGRLASAKVGDEFKWLDKPDEPCGYRLKSVDVSSGQVVVAEESFAMAIR